MPSRRAILVLNQYYAPGPESTAHLLTELCESLAADYDVTVITGTAELAPEPQDTVRNGVRVIRVGSTSYDRSKLWLRGVNYVSFVLLALAAGVRQARPHVVLCLSDPPFVSALGVAIARRHRAPLVAVTQDVFPEIAVALGRLTSRPVIAVLDQLVRFGLQGADRVVAIGETMQRRLEVKGVPADAIALIPNWTDAEALTPQPRDNAWTREQGLDGRFVVMHSGNLGYAQDLPALIRAATFLRDLDDLEIVIIGSGAQGAAIREIAERLDVPSVRFLPFQPRERLSESLSAASVHVVGLAPGLAGYVVPSRLYGILAVGRPVIVHAEADSETAQIVRASGCGVVIEPGRPELLAAAIRDAHAGHVDLEAMGSAGRAYVVEEATRELAMERYRELLAEVARP